MGPEDTAFPLLTLFPNPPTLPGRLDGRGTCWGRIPKAPSQGRGAAAFGPEVRES